MINYNINNSIIKKNCIHKNKCNLNKYGQCVYYFVLYCKLCNYGLKNIYDKCKNKDCALYLITITSEQHITHKYILEEDKLEEDTLEEDTLEEDVLEKYIEYKSHEYFHNGDCIINEYGQCKKGWKYFCSCGYGIEGYYTQCRVKNCPRYKGIQKDDNTINLNL